jgi:uncharacterized protein (DUF58 family)
VTRRPFTLTRRGWTVVGAAAGLLVGGRHLGADELSVLGVAAFAVLALAGVWVATTRPALTVTRRIAPARLHVDDVARVDLVVTATRATPLVDVTETIDRDRLRAHFLLAPLRTGACAEPAYRLPTDRRGPLALGPTTAVRSDRGSPIAGDGDRKDGRILTPREPLGASDEASGSGTKEGK